MSQSRVLPWEVIEGVIDHSANSTVTLYSFTLTCRQLRPRSTLLLLCRIQLKDRDHLFDLCAVLKANPNSNLQPCVRSVKIQLSEFSPYPLLCILPNLSEIKFEDYQTTYLAEGALPCFTFHPFVMTYCRQFGEHIQTLSLSDIMFSSLSALSEILLSFPRIRSFSCGMLHVKRDTSVLQKLVERCLSAQLRLNTLTIRGDVDNRFLVLLREVAKHTLVKLESMDYKVMRPSPTKPASGSEVVEPFRTLLLKSSPSEWVHLGSFTWQVPLRLEFKAYSEADPLFTSGVHHFITALQDFRPPKLREVTVDIHFGSFRDLVATLLPSASSELLVELETTLLTFPQPTLSFSSMTPLAVGRHHFWMKELIPFFPIMATRHALTINVESSGKAGHDGAISTAIVVSADSLWAATGSEDGTVIIWDTATGCIAQEWSAYPGSGVRSLSLSPDSRYILSAGDFGKCVVWDLHQDPRGGAMSLADCEGLNFMEIDFRCAWSAEGSWIASESHDGTVRLWDAHTFQRLHPNETWKGMLLAFSPDGRWIVTRESSDPKSVAWTHCHVWDVESGKLHRELRGHADRIGAAAFDSGSTRIVTGSDDGTIRIWDVETGEELLNLQDQEAMGISVGFVVYSPDTKLVLSSSSKNLPRHALRSGGVKIWDASTGALLACLARNLSVFFVPPYPACFSPCGQYVASASEEDGEACLWRTGDWSCVAKVPGARGTRRARVTQVAISPDGKMLCCGDEDGTVFFRHMCDLIPAGQHS